jgi:hypothetical protein
VSPIRLARLAHDAAAFGPPASLAAHETVTLRISKKPARCADESIGVRDGESGIGRERRFREAPRAGTRRCATAGVAGAARNLLPPPGETRSRASWHGAIKGRQHGDWTCQRACYVRVGDDCTAQMAAIVSFARRGSTCLGCS